METIVTTIHFAVALLIIGLILLQQGKGANMGASFGGGSSNTVFGSSGGGSFFGKLTGVLAFIFFVSSLGLTLIARDKSQIETGSILPALEVEQLVEPSADSGLPALPVEDYGSDVIPGVSNEIQAVGEDSLAPQLDSVESAAPATE